MAATWVGGQDFSVNYTIWKAQNYSMTVIAVGSDAQVPLPGSPFPVTIYPGPPDTTVAYVTGEGVSILASVLKWNEVVVIMVDVFENPVTVDSSGFKLSVTGPGASTYRSFVLLSPGKYLASYKVPSQGFYAVTVSYEDLLLPECPLNVSVGSVKETAKDFRATISPNTSLPAGEDVTVTIFANYTTNKPMKFIVELASEELTVGLIPDESNGKYSATINATLSGSYIADITLYGSQIKGTYTLQVKPGAVHVPLCAVIEMAAESIATTGVPKQVRVQTRDKFGNNAYSDVDENGNTVTFVMILSGPTMEEFSMDYVSEGMFVGNFVAREPGIYDLSIMAGLVDISGSPFMVTVS
ncbi:filamin-B-like [Selaginella moellendorffii]|uniref:filamin-B-like n=1 Tax=Selaginella moellendorffii TaxID=88036 RepID=UPI000D1C3C76|nr:filamin-B-like [Selaginella moellendorffii]|eukprot:XP_024542960.1 filamin-B-like [Selaginella moellendorffii]